MAKATCTISIEPALLDALDKYAESLGETRSVVIQRFVREGLKRAPKEKSPQL